MSKNLNFRMVSPTRCINSKSKVQIKFLPLVKTVSHKELESYYNPTYSVSKSREKKVLNISLEIKKPEENNTKTHKEYVKQYTQSTESLSEYSKEIATFESKLSSMDQSKTHIEKYAEINEVWSDIIKSSGPFSILFTLLKNGIENIYKEIQKQLDDLNNINQNYLETKHTLKIFKKRFQKLALENLEINNLIIENENEYSRQKEKFKIIIEKGQKDLEKKEEIIKNLTQNVQSNRIYLYKKKLSLEYYKKKVKIFSQFIQEIKHQRPYKEMHEKVLMTELELKKITKGNLKNISMDFREDLNHLSPPDNPIKPGSSFSTKSLDSLVQ